MRDIEDFAGVIIPVVLFLLLIFVNVFVGGSCLQYCLNFWTVHMAHSAAATWPFWPCAFVSLFLGELFILFAIVTWILSFLI